MTEATVQKFQEDDELSLLDLLIVLAKYKRLIIGLPILFAVVALVVVLIIPPKYKSTIRILPPVMGSSTAVMMLSGAGGGILGMGKNPSDIYVSLLKSHSVEDTVIRRFNLKAYYDKKYVEDVRKKFEEDVESKASKDGLIEISFEHKDPKTAAAIANAMVDALQGINERLAITEAARRRLHFEKELLTNKQSLVEAESALKTYQQKTGVIQPQQQGGATLGAMATLESTIAGNEVRLAGMKSFATPNNPDYIMVERELRGLKDQLAKLRGNKHSTENAATISKSNLPEAGIEFNRKIRDLKYFETLNEVFSKQYEMAKADEAKEGTLIQVVDEAVPAEKKSSPKRAMIVLLSTVAGLFMGILLAFVRNAIANGANDPRSVARMAELKRALGR